MKKYIIIIICIILGSILGYLAPTIPYSYSKYTAVAIIAALDSVFGGLVSSLQGKFNMKIFISGFFGNGIIAIALVFLGIRLGVDVYLAAIIVFVQRMLINFSVIRRILLSKYENKENANEGSDAKS